MVGTKSSKTVAKLLDDKNQFKRSASVSIVCNYDDKLTDISCKLEALLGNQSKLDNIEQLTFQMSRQQLSYENRLKAFEQENRFLQHKISENKQAAELCELRGNQARSREDRLKDGFQEQNGRSNGNLIVMVIQ